MSESRPCPKCGERIFDTFSPILCPKCRVVLELNFEDINYPDGGFETVFYYEVVEPGINSMVFARYTGPV